MKSKDWYHGTKNVDKILETMTLVPGNLHDVKSLKMFTPQYNRTYLTQSIEYALIYAFGCNLSCRKPINDTAYICVIDGNDLNDINPDEDIIADLIQRCFTSSNSIRKDISSIEIDFVDYIKRNITSKQLSLAMDDYGHGTKVGKTLIKNMSDDMKIKLINYSVDKKLATLGGVNVKEIWKLDVDKYDDIKKDVINFKNYAIRIK